MSVAVCGLDCSACGYLGTACAEGCESCKGRVFWAQFVEDGNGLCPMWACADGKGYAHCGQCGAMPCGLWHSTREDGVSDADFDRQLKEREARLRALPS